MIIKRARVVRWLVYPDSARHTYEKDKGFHRVRNLAIEQNPSGDVIVICSDEKGTYIDEIWYLTLEEALDDIPTGFVLSPERWVDEPLTE